MAESTANGQETTPQGGQTAQAGNANQEGSSAAAFSPIETQEQLDRIVEQRLWKERKKYEGFETFKEKAEKFDALEAASKTELEKATERADAAEKELAKLREAAQRSEWVSEVSKETGLHYELVADLSAGTRDELLEKAKRHVEAFRAKPAPYVGNDGRKQGSPAATNEDAFAEIANQFFK